MLNTALKIFEHRTWSPSYGLLHFLGEFRSRSLLPLHYNEPMEVRTRSTILIYSPPSLLAWKLLAWRPPFPWRAAFASRTPFPPPNGPSARRPERSLLAARTPRHKLPVGGHSLLSHELDRHLEATRKHQRPKKAILR